MPKHDKCQYSLREVYSFYKNRCKEREHTPVDYKMHKLILDTWGSIVSEYIVAGKDVKLHSGMATIRIRKFKRATYVDSKASKEAGRAVRKSNSHSGFYTTRVGWTRHYTTVNSRGWRFRPCRKLAQAIVAVMKTPGGHTQYVKKAKVTSHEHQRKSMYNKQILSA